MSSPTANAALAGAQAAEVPAKLSAEGAAITTAKAAAGAALAALNPPAPAPASAARLVVSAGRGPGKAKTSLGSTIQHRSPEGATSAKQDTGSGSRGHGAIGWCLFESVRDPDLEHRYTSSTNTAPTDIIANPHADASRHNFQRIVGLQLCGLGLRRTDDAELRHQLRCAR